MRNLENSSSTLNHDIYFLEFQCKISLLLVLIGRYYDLQLPTISPYSSARLDIGVEMGEKGSHLEHDGRTNNRARRLFKI